MEKGHTQKNYEGGKQHELLGCRRRSLTCPGNICFHRVMIKKLLKSLREFPLNGIICITVIVMYFANNLFFKQHSGDGLLNYILVCHFNDTVGGLLFVSYTNILLNTRHQMLERWSVILVFCLSAGVFWEFVTPIFRKNTTSDVIDVICYAIGGSIYWLLAKLVRNIHGNTE